mmetsp:Transcript_4816/g.13617  ORF Transcript_4816/g.13617 Transcript_4816/m.13617 type:complete len:298 (+) Transcript_4816:80-973(+)
MSSFFESLTKAVSSPSPNRSSSRTTSTTPGTSASSSSAARTPATSSRRTPATSRSVSGTPRTPLLSPVATEAEREQALRDYKVTIEYKHLKNHAPGGVYLLPSFTDLRHFHGVIFVRRGPYTNGIFKFELRLPPKYNDVDAWPIIKFSSRVYNPHVDPGTGVLDLRSAYPTWDPHRHYLVTVLTYLKKIFYMKTFPGGDGIANPSARDQSVQNPTFYRKLVDECVRDSQKAVFVNDVEGCTAKFSEEELCHEVLRELMHKNLKDPSTMTRTQVLEMVQEASERAGQQQKGAAVKTEG